MRGPKQIIRGVARRVGNLLVPSQAEQHELIHAVKNEMVGEIHGVHHQLQAAEAVHQGLEDQQAMTGARIEVVLNELLATRDEVGFARNDILDVLARMMPSSSLKSLHGARLADIDAPTAGFLNYVRSHRGPLADAGLWINEPVVVEWRPREVRVATVNERIIEQPFVHGALGSLPPGSHVVDVGGGESLVGLAQASSGHQVTVVEPAGYPFEHPNLTVARHTVADFAPDEPVDAVVLLSAIEHFGIGAYSDDGGPDHDADLAAMGRVRDLLAPSGIVVLTTPFGPAAVDELERTYDQPRLRALFEGYEIDEVQVGAHRDDTTWTVTSRLRSLDELTTPSGPGHVAMVRAHRPA